MTCKPYICYNSRLPYTECWGDAMNVLCSCRWCSKPKWPYKILTWITKLIESSRKQTDCKLIRRLGRRRYAHTHEMNDPSTEKRSFCWVDKSEKKNYGIGRMLFQHSSQQPTILEGEEVESSNQKPSKLTEKTPNTDNRNGKEPRQIENRKPLSIHTQEHITLCRRGRRRWRCCCCYCLSGRAQE